MSSRNAHLGIVVGVDDSPAAKVAVDWAARDAELRNVSLTLVHAVSPNLTTWWNTPLSPGLAQWQKEHGRRLLDDAVKVAENACEHPGLSQIHTEVLSSAAIPTLVDLSKDAESGSRRIPRQWGVARPDSRFGQYRAGPARALPGRDHPR